MYSEKLEKLIEFALAGGILTGKKKQDLIKQAEDEGIDANTFKTELDSQLSFKIRTLISIGHEYSVQNEHNKAVEAYSQVLTINPKNETALIARGTLYLKMYEFEKSRNDLETAIKFVEKKPEYKSGLPALYTLLGQTYYFEQKWQDAFRSFNKAITLDSETGIAYEWCGYLFSKQGSAKKAEKYFQQAIQFDSSTLARINDFKSEETVNELISKGEECLEKGKYGKAIKLYSQALELDPDNHDILYSRGTAYCNNANYEKSRADMISAISLVESNPEYCSDKNSLNYLSLMYIVIGRTYYNENNWEKALQALNKAVTYDSSEACAYEWLGYVYFKQGDKIPAQKYFEKAIELDSSLKPRILYYTA